MRPLKRRIKFSIEGLSYFPRYWGLSRIDETNQNEERGGHANCFDLGL